MRATGIFDFLSAWVRRPLAGWPGIVAIAAILSLKFYLVNRMIAVNGAVGVTTAIALAAAVFACVGWVWLAPRPWRLPLLIGVDLAATVLVLSDAIYLRFFNDLLPFGAVAHSHQLFEVRDSVFALLSLKDLALFADVAVLIALLPLRAPSEPDTPWRTRAAAYAAIAISAGGFLLFTFAQFEKTYPNAFTSIWSKKLIGRSIGLPAYHAFDAFQVGAAKLAARRDPAKEAQIEVLWKQKNAPRPGLGWGLAQGKNLIVVQLESFQALAIGRRIGGKELTPNLNRLVAGSLYFENVYPQTASGRTSDAEFMLNTSLYPASEGAAFVRFSQNGFLSLGGALKERGYRTLVLHANAPNFWNRYAMYPALGFERYHSKDDYVSDELIGLGLSDRSFFAQSFKKLSALDGPFYAECVTLTSHHPYQHTKRYGDFDMGDLAGSYLGKYLKSLSYVDRELGSFIARLKASGRWDDTVLVVYGDHEGVDVSHKRELMALLGETVDTPASWVAMTKVPLLIHLPGEPLKGVKPIAAGQVDFLPTIANLLGVRVPTALGQDLLNARAGFVAFRDGSVATDAGYYHAATDSAFSLSTQQRVDKAGMAEAIATAARHLSYSDYILQHDLTRKFREARP